jgi:hypothetical protein
LIFSRYDKEDAPTKKKKAQGAKAAAAVEKSSVALRPRRTIQSYFEKQNSDEEEIGIIFIFFVLFTLPSSLLSPSPSPPSLSCF